MWEGTWSRGRYQGKNGKVARLAKLFALDVRSRSERRIRSCEKKGTGGRGKEGCIGVAGPSKVPYLKMGVGCGDFKMCSEKKKKKPKKHRNGYGLSKAKNAGRRGFIQLESKQRRKKKTGRIGMGQGTSFLTTGTKKGKYLLGLET